MSGTTLPDHKSELSQAEELIEKYKVELKENRSIIVQDNRSYTIFHQKIVQVLEYVGDLSLPAFNLSDYLEREYFLRYKSSPELAKKLWTDHYHNIHKPYNVLKNRCFTLLDKLEEEFFRQHNVLPPADF